METNCIISLYQILRKSIQPFLELLHTDGILWAHFAFGLCKSWKMGSVYKGEFRWWRGGDCYLRAVPCSVSVVSRSGIRAVPACLLHAFIAWCWNTRTAFTNSDCLWIFLSILQLSAARCDLAWIRGVSCTKYRPPVCSCPCTFQPMYSRLVHYIAYAPARWLIKCTAWSDFSERKYEYCFRVKYWVLLW